MSKSIHDIKLNSIGGKPAMLSDYEGQVVLAVNVASKCGFTPQYAGLQAIYEKYSPQGFTVLGFPCNQFHGQEPGSEAQIEQFCQLNYGVSFPLFQKLDVKGGKQHPLYSILTQAADQTGTAGDVKWNFEKFLVGKDGRVVKRFRSKIKPEDPELVGAIEELL
jgi:glutathione peroxidase